ncbi:MAG: bifunctional alpha,alpha-trehalose-phosphate synthase (UDP-forming)/trehalose-phosphatase [Acholeplasmataceae bacterium]
MSKTIFVSNRLPVTVSKKDDHLSYQKSIGGLATGLKSFHQSSDSLWIGWPGIASSAIDTKEKKDISKTLHQSYQCQPVFLTERDIDNYYEGFSNKTIWPLFHYFAEKTEHSNDTWESYKTVNLKFYDAIKDHIEPDSMIWIHDYQLMLLPQLIREKHPYVNIGFFLHIPFPSYELFRLLIWKKEILNGLLGADLIGFHTYDYVRHFLSSIRRILNIHHELYKIKHSNRIIEIDAFPMGIDYDYFFNQTLIEPKEKKHQIILSVDRLDYTKGIVERIEAFKTFLETYPEFHNKVKLHLIVAPSRQNLPTYDALKRKIEKQISEVNGKYGSFDWMPIWYLYQTFDQEDLIHYYQESDLLLVTPLRDGMNLIAKEYLASRSDYQGMIIISETAGAASELSEAFIVNPNDDQEISARIYEALTLSKEEKEIRNKIMHKRIKRYNVEFWADTFMNRLKRVSHQTKRTQDQEIVNIKDLKSMYHKANKRLILLDYDGTLVDFTQTPSEASPDNHLKSMLKKLQEDKKNKVVIISGRDHQTLDKWLGDLDLNLVGDHGLWLKKQGQTWQQTLKIDDSWKTSIRHVLDVFVDQMPGAFIEDKTHSLAFHYRRSEPDMVALKRMELKEALISLKGTRPLEIQQGNMVIEVKDQRINKGQASFVFTSETTYDFILIAGDDTTDEDMFKAQRDAYNIKIGYGESVATKRVFDVSAFRKILNQLIDA